MSLEQAIEKLTAAIEAATGVLVTLQAAAGKAASAPAAAAPAPAAPAAEKGKPGRKPAAAAPAPALAADDDSGLGDGGLGDGGLGGGDEPTVTGDDAKKLVLAFRDAAIKKKGKDEGLNATRTLMKKFVGNLDEISDENAGAIHAAFSAEMAKLK